MLITFSSDHHHMSILRRVFWQRTCDKHRRRSGRYERLRQDPNRSLLRPFTDIWPAEQRGMAMVGYAMALVGGPTLGTSDPIYCLRSPRETSAGSTSSMLTS